LILQYPTEALRGLLCYLSSVVYLNHMDFSLPEKPLVAKQGKVEPNQRTYFFEREDGTTFFAQAQEAWSIYKGRNQIIGFERPRIKFIGSSDGSIYRQAVIEAQQIFRQEGLEKAQERLRRGADEELASARGQMIPPPNFDYTDRHNRPADSRTIGL